MTRQPQLPGEGNMAGPQPESDILIGDFSPVANLRRFSHNAMAAPFDVFVVHHDALYAEQAAWAAFEELDRLESNLSRFIDNSDVARINSLSGNCPLQIGLTTFECLRMSIEMCAQTNNAFDVTVGSLYNCWLNKDRTLRKPSKKELDIARKKTGSNLLKLNESDHTIESRIDGVQIDFGAVGKGYAADKMGQVLREWGIKTALISAGQSTILPIGSPADMPGWPLSLSDPADYRKLIARVYLAGQAISASGLHKGPHIINPHSGKPVTRQGAWATAQTAAVADALSTAFMVMPVDKIRAFCSAHTDTAALLVNKKTGGRLLRFGQWDKADFCG